jgi:mannose-6-phosphate isomerase-like protein (cupin superfamily)
MNAPVTSGAMAEVIAEGPGRRLDLLCEHEALHATWTRYGPGREGADRHVHRRHTDVFYVLAGEFTLLHEHGEATVEAGRFVWIPPMVVHGFANRGDGALEYLNFHAPGLGFADYLRGLARGERVPFDQEPPPDTGLRPFDEVRISAGTQLEIGARRTFGFAARDGAWGEVPVPEAAVTLTV